MLVVFAASWLADVSLEAPSVTIRWGFFRLGVRPPALSNIGQALDKRGDRDAKVLILLAPLGDSNPCFSRERDTNASKGAQSVGPHRERGRVGQTYWASVGDQLPLPTMVQISAARISGSGKNGRARLQLKACSW
jgi:hypothetical protein